MVDAEGTSSNIDSAEGLASEGQEGLEGQPSKAPDEPWRKVKHKYKAAGREVEVSYEELLKRAEKADGAEEKFRMASEKEKEAKALKARIEKVKDPTAEDWDDLIELIGWEKAQKFADNLVWNKIQWEELSQEQRELIQAKHEADRTKGELKSIKEREAQKERQELLQKSQSIITNEIDSVLKKAKSEGLPVADIPEIQELIIDEMIAYLEMMEDAESKGQRVPAPPSHEDVLRTIQDRFNQRSDVYVKRLSVDSLKKLLTREQLEGLRQAEIDQLYAPIPKSGTQQKNQSNDDPFERPANTKKTARRMRTEDYFARLDQSFGR